MKRGLIMEGGAMRGLFTAGVIDVFMEKGIEFDGAIGVSAGAAFGCNYKSKQIGRVLRYNSKFCNDSRYSGFRSLFTSGDLYNKKFYYDDLPKRVDVFDMETYAANPMEFYVVCTNMDTGEPVYKRLDKFDDAELEWLRASASLPIVSTIVEQDGMKLSDGGTSDSVPLKYFESLGYDRNVVICTQPYGFRKEKLKPLWLIKLLLYKYPALAKALEERYVMYNETMLMLDERAKRGEIILIRPPEALNIAPLTKPSEVHRVYQIGRREGEKWAERVKLFLR